MSRYLFIYLYCINMFFEKSGFLLTKRTDVSLCTWSYITQLDIANDLELSIEELLRLEGWGGGRADSNLRMVDPEAHV